MDKKGNCSQCNKEFSRKHLSPIINDLVRHKTAFRKVFEKNENPKFCKACKNKWLDLGKIKSDKVKEFIENMTSLNKKETSIDDDEKNDTGNQIKMTRNSMVLKKMFLTQICRTMLLK